MSERQAENPLLDMAMLGQEFEDWKQSRPTQALLTKLRKKAEVARELCVELSPHTDLQALVEAQNEVQVFKRMVEAIDEFINAGKSATAEIRRGENAPLD